VVVVGIDTKEEFSITNDHNTLGSARLFRLDLRLTKNCHQQQQADSIEVCLYFDTTRQQQQHLRQNDFLFFSF
jgi:hypothetical protein